MKRSSLKVHVEKGQHSSSVHLLDEVKRTLTSSVFMRGMQGDFVAVFLQSDELRYISKHSDLIGCKKYIVIYYLSL